MLEQVLSAIYQATGIQPPLLKKIFLTIAIILFLWLFRLLVGFIIQKRTKNIRHRYNMERLSGSLVILTGIIAVSVLWFRESTSLVTYLGFLSAGLAIALKDPITNMFGWVYIVLKRPFTLRDRIEVGEKAGDVIDISLFQFTLLEIGNWVDADQSTGRIIHINNARVFTDPLANYSKGFYYIWNELPVLITFESDWKLGKKILEEISLRHSAHLSEAAEKKILERSRKYLIYYSHLTPAVYTTVKDSGILLTIRYLCEPRRRRDSEQRIWEDVLDAFSLYPGIQLAYPTQRITVPDRVSFDGDPVPGGLLKPDKSGVEAYTGLPRNECFDDSLSEESPTPVKKKTRNAVAAKKSEQTGKTKAKSVKETVGKVKVSGSGASSKTVAPKSSVKKTASDILEKKKKAAGSSADSALNK